MNEKSSSFTFSLLEEPWFIHTLGRKALLYRKEKKKKKPGNKPRRNGRIRRITICSFQGRGWLRQGPAVGAEAIKGRKRMVVRTVLPHRLPLSSPLWWRDPAVRLKPADQAAHHCGRAVRGRQPDIRVVQYHTAHSITGEVAILKRPARVYSSLGPNFRSALGGGTG